MVEILDLGSFLKTQNLAHLWINVLYSLFLSYAQVEGYRNLLKQRCKPLAFTSYKTFSKNVRGLELVPLSYFLHDFGRNLFLTLHSIKFTNFIVCLYLLLEVLVNMCFIITCYTGCDVIDFDLNLSFLIKLFFHMTEKVGTKI